MSKYEGTVQNGTFRPTSGETVRVTTIRPEAGQAPYDIDLADYEGSRIEIEGELQGGWIYSARIMESGNWSEPQK